MKCDLCGKLAMIIRDGGRRTICCDQLMVKQVERGPETGGEMHVPAIRKSGNGILVSVASVANPMEEDHYIEWIEVTKGNDRYVRILNPGDPPVAEFALTGPGIKARAYCEEHGLWSNKPSGPKI